LVLRRVYQASATAGEVIGPKEVRAKMWVLVLILIGILIAKVLL